MAQSMPESSSIFDRIEVLRKWQFEQQQRLVQQKSQHHDFLSKEQKRMKEAFNIPSENVDNIPINSPQKEFSVLVEEQMENGVETPVVRDNAKPKRPFLKKGTGLGRFRMTINDLAHKKPSPALPPKSKYQKRQFTKATNPEEKTKSDNHESNMVWTPVPQQPQNDPYQQLLNELIEVRSKNPSLFDTPVINKSAENDQKLFEREIMDELKLFEALEQKTANSSFCSNSSLVARLMDHSFKSTPKKNQNTSIHSIPEEPKRVSFTEIQSSECSEESSDNVSVTSECSSVTSSDVCDYNTPKEIKKEMKEIAVNTDIPAITSELLKTRLEELEKELQTFRSENVRITKLKSQLETDSRNLEKRKRNLEKEVEEQKKAVKQQLDEERAKLIKEKSVYDRYLREIKEGKSLRQKEKEELIILKSRLSTVEEELKLKEAKWGAAQARLRSQLKNLEKENASLRTENNELRSKNGKLEATNRQLLSRRPTETKVLHEINKNLSKLTQEAKDKKLVDKSKKEPQKPTKKTPKRSSSSSTTPHSSPYEKENYTSSVSSSEPSLESVEQEYKKTFGVTETPVNKFDETGLNNSNPRKEETVLDDGSIKITYANGNEKTISNDGTIITVKYHNGDIKECCRETGIIKYIYADSSTCHTTFPDGLEILEFENGQMEKRYPNGSTEIHFPNGSHRCTSPGGTEEISFADGTILKTMPSGDRILTLPNGQREVHTKDHKRREYPDGTVKLLYADGVQETRYANGRIRLKDKLGNLIMDSAAV